MREILSQKIRWRLIGENTQCQPPASAHASIGGHTFIDTYGESTYAYVNTHTNIHKPKLYSRKVGNVPKPQAGKDVAEMVVWSSWLTFCAHTRLSGLTS